MSKWPTFWESLGQRSGRPRNDAVIVRLLPQPFSSEVKSSTDTLRRTTSEELTSQQKQNSGVMHLTRVFRELLKLSDEKHSGSTDDLKSLKTVAAKEVYFRLLKSCSRDGNSKLAKEVWGVMRSNAIRMRKLHYCFLLGALSRGGCTGEAVELLEILVKTNEANVVMCNTVLYGCVHNQKKDHAERCVQLMETHGIQKDERTYIELIKFSGVLKDLSAIEAWWRRFLASGTPSPVAWFSYVYALCESTEITAARQALKDMVSVCGLELVKRLIALEGMSPMNMNHPTTAEKTDASLSSNRNDNNQQGETFCQPCYSRTLTREERFVENSNERSLDVHGMEADVEDESLQDQDGTLQEEEFEINLFFREDFAVPGYPHELSSRHIRLSEQDNDGILKLRNAYTALMNAARKAKNHILVEVLFSEMRQLGFNLDLRSYHVLLRSVLEERGVKHGLRILKRMESNGTEPDVYCLTALMGAYCRMRSFREAQAVLEYMESCRPIQHPSPHSYSVFLQACSSGDRTEQAFNAFGRMKQLGVAPDIYIYTALFTILRKTGRDPDGSSDLIRQQIEKTVLNIESDMAHFAVRHTPISFTCLMQTLGAHGLIEMMVKRLEDARSCGDELLNVTSYNAIIQALIYHYQVETAWKIYEQMKQDGIKPDECTYSLMINSCTYENRLASAYELASTFRQEGFTPNIFVFNALLKVICRSGKTELVFDLMDEMTSSGLQPNAATFNIIHSLFTHLKRTISSNGV